MKIVVLNHCSRDDTKSYKNEFGDILLLRAVKRINQYLKPDITLLSSALISDGECDSELRAIISRLEHGYGILDENYNYISSLNVQTPHFDQELIAHLPKRVFDCSFYMKPFRFFEVSCGKDGDIECEEHHLSMPEELELIDFHTHSHFAYCNENMDFEKAERVRKLFNIKRLACTEHSAHLYFSREEYDKGQHDIVKAGKHIRMGQYFSELHERGNANILIGLEVDCGPMGKPVVTEHDRKQCDVILGSLHTLCDYYLDEEFISDEILFKGIMERFLKQPMDILAHPFRCFRRSKAPVPRVLFPAMVNLLKRYNIAAEINCHHNEPPLEFIQICLEEGVKLAFGSDAHNLCQIGEFYPHLKLLKKVGVTGDLSKILFSPNNSVSEGL